MGNSGNHFRWTASLSGAVVFGRNGKRGLILFGAHAFRTFGALCLFLALGMSPVRNALASEHAERLAPEIVQEMQCGSHKVVIPCGKYRPGEEGGYHPVKCAHNPLKFIDKKGRGKLVPGLGEHGSSTESVVCGVGRNGRHYIEALAQDCGKYGCGGDYYLFEEDGSVIAMKDVDDAPDITQDYDQIVAQNKIHFRGHPARNLALMQCGSHRVAITCDKAAQNGLTCLHNKVKFIDAMGRVKTARGLSQGNRNPSSMHCGVGRDGKRYVEVLVYSCNMPSCGELVMLTEDGHEIAIRSALGDEDSAQSRRYDRFMDRNKIRFTKSFGE